jgi:hypothetical protein
MTDLQSTNGTRINGESVRVWQLHPGDLITVGRSSLLFGSTAEIAERLAMLKSTNLLTAVSMGTEGDESDFLNRTLSVNTSNWTQSSQLLAKEIFNNLGATDLTSLRLLPPQVPPKDLPPPQAAQMEAFLQYLHLRLRHLIATVRSTPNSPMESPANVRITISASQWQNIVDLHARISAYMTPPASNHVD